MKIICRTETTSFKLSITKTEESARTYRDSTGCFRQAPHGATHSCIHVLDLL